MNIQVRGVATRQTIWLLLLIALGATLSIALLTKYGNDAAEAGPAIPVESQAAETSEPTLHEVTDPGALERAVAEMEAQEVMEEAVSDATGAPPSLLVQEEALIPRPRVPDSYFESQYAGSGRAQLVVEKLRVEEDFFSMQRSVVEDRFDAGLYETSIEERQAELNLGALAPKNTSELIQVRRSRVLENNQLEVKLMTVPWEEYQQLYDLHDELSWLNRKISTLGGG